jgi:hypothetical protein
MAPATAMEASRLFDFDLTETCLRVPHAHTLAWDPESRHFLFMALGRTLRV